MKAKEIRQHLDQIYESKSALFRAEVIRSERFTGELGEYIAENLLGGERASSTSNPGWDMTATINSTPNQRVQVKCHAKGATNNARWTEFKNIEKFDWLMVIVLTPDYRLKEAYLVRSEDLENIAKKNKQGIWLVMWSDLQKSHLFKLPENNTPFLDAFLSKVSQCSESVFPDPGQETVESFSEKWEILNGFGTQEICFSPICWRPWNVTSGGAKETNRKLIFEYRTPLIKDANNKITLRGLIPDPTPKGNLALLVADYEWTLPRAARPKTTVGYAIWGTNARSSRNKIPPYPSKGFTSNHDFLVWLDSWENLVGVTPTGSLQNFITSVCLASK